jgi:hypothetical protein
MVSAGSHSANTLLNKMALEGHHDVTNSLNMHGVNLKSSEKAAL